LIFACKRWGNTSNMNYSNYAMVMLQSIARREIYNDPDTGRKFVTAGCGNWGGSWGRPNGWNPSYVTLVWFPIFEDFMKSHDSSYETGFWNKVHIDTAYILYQVDRVLGGHGLLPDWVDSSDLSNPKQSETFSDRGKLPFNCYYDAVRVPWRLALDRSWHGNGSGYAFSITNRLYHFIESKGGLANIVDGYMPDGSPFDVNYADWNNIYGGDYGEYYNRIKKPTNVTTITNARGQNVVVGGMGLSPTFAAMFATVCMNSTSGSDSIIKSYYEMVKANKEPYGHNYSYYGDTLRLFSLLYLTGNMKNLYNCHWANIYVGSIKGLTSNFLIKSRTQGSYLAKYEDSNNIHMVKEYLSDLQSGHYEAKWRFVDSDKDGWGYLINVAAESNGSSAKYLYGSTGSAACWLGDENAGDENHRTWRLYDNSGGNSLFTINPKWSSSYRIYASNATTEVLNTSTGGGKYWQLIMVN